MGNSHRRTSAILYSWTAMFAFPTAVAAFAPVWVALVVGLVILLFSLALIRKSLVSSNVAANSTTE
jgi:UDP-GlcNAc:undecaprenyl-phosphate GlcNAc-1-phosphate transferase